MFNVETTLENAKLVILGQLELKISLPPRPNHGGNRSGNFPQENIPVF